MALSNWPILACICLLVAVASAFEFRGKEVIGFRTMSKGEVDASAAAGNTLVWDRRYVREDDMWWGLGKYMTAKKGEHEGDRSDRYFCVVTADRDAFADAPIVRIPAIKATNGGCDYESLRNDYEEIETYIDAVGGDPHSDIRVVSDDGGYYQYEIVIPESKLNGAHGGLGIGVWCTQNLDELPDETVDVESGPYDQNVSGEFDAWEPDSDDDDDSDED